MSFVFRNSTQELPYFVGNAVLKALQVHLPAIGLKWPNDLVIEIDGKLCKIGGIVLQRHLEDLEIVVAGIGINLQFSKDRPTEDAIALNEVVANLPDINQLIFEIIMQLSKEQTDVISEYKKNCLTLGKKVVVQLLNSADVVGVAADISENGALIIQDENGLVEVFTGDVKHLRANE